MRLKSGFITENIDGELFMIAVDDEAFNGVVKSNDTAAFIVGCLKEETTEDQIVDRMCAEYDAPRELIAADVKECITKLRSIHALEE